MVSGLPPEISFFFLQLAPTVKIAPWHSGGAGKNVELEPEARRQMPIILLQLALVIPVMTAYQSPLLTLSYSSPLM